MPAIKEHRLATGDVVSYRSRADLDILARELLADRHLYLRHGIRLDDGACVFDVGANIGFFLLSLGRILKRGSVYAFEPIPEVHEVLRLNAARQSHLDVQLFACGLAQASGSATFRYYPRTSVASSMVPDFSPEFRRNSRRFIHQEIISRGGLPGWLATRTPVGWWFPVTELIRQYYHASREVKCPLRTLSEVIEQAGVQCIDLLKVDTEGAEESVLAGLQDEHWGRVRQLVVEVHDGRPGLERMERLLQHRGFRTASEAVLPGVPHLYVVFARRAAS
jgi:FkbM family methyltransferase